MNIYRKSDIPEHLQQYFEPAELGLEKTPELYVENLVKVFREVRRVLRDDGVVWIVIGDSYASSTKSGGRNDTDKMYSGSPDGLRSNKRFITETGLKAKNLVGIPWRVAFALQSDGWYLRSDIIWCLSGGAWLYVRSQKGDMPMMTKDIARLNPTTVQLWDGKKWTQLRGMNKSEHSGNELEIVLRSGERVSCTPAHRFPTNRGLLDAANIQVGDVLQSCVLPEPEVARDCVVDEDAAWLAGLYIAEGSRSGNTIQIAGHAKELIRWDRVQRIAKKFGGSATHTVNNNNMSIRIYGKVLHAIINELVRGRTAHDKGFAPIVWRYSNRFIGAMLDGYLSGDGSKDGNRWRLGFCRNYNLERDLRTVSARLGFCLTLNLASVRYDGRCVPVFRGELRKTRSGHHNEKDRNEVVAIRKARCRYVYSIGVDSDSHLFALASGVLTHNSKPNPMPDGVTDRPTNAHEHIFLLSKQSRYYYNADAIKEPLSSNPNTWGRHTKKDPGVHAVNPRAMFGADRGGRDGTEFGDGESRNKRDVWTVATRPYAGAHFAAYPPMLIEPCVLAGCPSGGTVLDPFAGSGTTALVARGLGRKSVCIEVNADYLELQKKRLGYCDHDFILD